MFFSGKRVNHANRLGYKMRVGLAVISKNGNLLEDLNRTLTGNSL